jgi:glycoside/pentoside/hexuronide:cation symporter, GPH family
VAIFLSIMISCVGTHRFIGTLVHSPLRGESWRKKLREVSGTLTNRSFLALAVAGIIGTISTGVSQGLDLYIGTYFWELTPAQISYLAVAALVAAFAGVGLAPAISRRFGKKPAMIGVFFASLFAGVAPITMRLLGLLPANRTGALFTIVIVFYFISATLGLTGFIIVSSMMADVVEDAVVTTRQRSEDLLFAANGLISKCVTGIGTFLSGLILTWVRFPQHAIQGQVDPAILRHLGLVFVPIVAPCSAIAIAVLLLYDIDRSTHLRNVEWLESADEPNSDARAKANVNGEQAGARAVS